jgi:hypothetical protein
LESWTNLKMEAASSFKTSVRMYKYAWLPVVEDESIRGKIWCDYGLKVGIKAGGMIVTGCREHCDKSASTEF